MTSPLSRCSDVLRHSWICTISCLRGITVTAAASYINFLHLNERKTETMLGSAEQQRKCAAGAYFHGLALSWDQKTWAHHPSSGITPLPIGCRTDFKSFLIAICLILIICSCQSAEVLQPDDSWCSQMWTELFQSLVPDHHYKCLLLKLPLHSSLHSRLISSDVCLIISLHKFECCLIFACDALRSFFNVL